MAYIKKVWKDAPDTSTPINAANLNHMEDGIATADVNAQDALDRLDDVDDEIAQINSDLTDKVGNSWTFIGASSVTNLNYTLTNEAKLSDYKYLCMALIIDSTRRITSMIPRNFFETITSSEGFYWGIDFYDAPTNQRTACLIHKNSDTNISIQLVGSGVSMNLDGIN